LEDRFIIGSQYADGEVLLNKPLSIQYARSALKIAEIMGLICLVVSLLYIKGSYAEGYEISIYDAYSCIFWISMIGLLFLGIVMLILCSCSKQKYVSVIGPIIIFAYYMILISLRSMRGYPFADPQDLNLHASQLYDIVNSGHVGSTNFYPVLNLFSESLRMLSGLPQTWTADVTTIATIVVFLLPMYLLASIVFRHRITSAVCLGFAAIPIFGYGYYYHPSISSVLLVPLILFLLHQSIFAPSSKKRSYLVLLTPVALCEPLYHPMTCLMIIIALLLFAFYRLVCSGFRKENGFMLSFSKFYSSPEFKIGLMLALVTLIWSLGFYHIQQNIRIIYATVFENDGLSVYALTADLVTEAGLTIPQLVNLYINTYGAFTLYLLPTAILLLILVLSGKFRRYLVKNNPIGQYLFVFTMLVGFSAIMFFTQVAEANLIRIFRVPIILSALLGGFVSTMIITYFYKMCSSKVKKGIVLCCAVIYLISLVCLSTLCFYPSPWISQPNYQVTQMELSATGWVFENTPRGSILGDYNIRATYVPAYHIQKRFFSQQEYGDKIMMTDKSYIPTHFGYDRQSTLYDALYGQRTLILTGKKDLVFRDAFPENVRMKFKRIYDLEDFNRLDQDPTVNCVYRSGECSIHLISGI